MNLALNRNVLVDTFGATEGAGLRVKQAALVVAGVAIATRRDGADLHRRLTGTLLAVGAASFAYSVYLTLVNQPLAYFHSATRIWEFALGGLLALWISRIEDRPELTPGTRAVLGWGGVAALVSCGILLQVDRAFPGWAALWPTLAAAMVLVAGRSGHRFGVDRLLSGRVLRTIGDISFPLYLWHWPILTLTLVRTGQDRLDLEQGAAVIAVSFVLAWLTHRFVEQRIAALEGGVAALALGEGHVEGDREAGQVVPALVADLVPLGVRGEGRERRPLAGEVVEVDRPAAGQRRQQQLDRGEVGVVTPTDRQHSPAAVGGLVAVLPDPDHVDGAQRVVGSHGVSLPEVGHPRGAPRTRTRLDPRGPSGHGGGFTRTRDGRRAMLTLTQNATLIVKEIADQSGGTEGSGLRITAEPGPEAGLSVTTAETAEPGDQVLEQDGATVYLDQDAATMLDDKVLDAAVDESGRVEFALGVQG